MNSRFVRFFEAGDAGFLIESIYVYAYSDLGCLSFRKNNNVTILFDSLDMETCFRECNSLMSSSERYANYENKFRLFMEKANKTIGDDISRMNGQTIAKLFIEFLSFYRWTEFFYTDQVYQLSDKNDVLENNLRRLESLKTEGRIFLNTMTNGYNSILYQFQSLSHDNELFDRSIEELLNNSYNIIPFLRRQNHLLMSDHHLIDSSAHLFREVNKWIDEDFQVDECIIKGIAASRGIAKGNVFVLSSNFDTYDRLDDLLREVPDGIILVSETTSPDIISACYKAKGIVTNQGGLGSHAAIISREIGIPCVVGTKNATHMLKNGDLVCVDGMTGEVHKIVE